jgi:hypothetical protein
MNAATRMGRPFFRGSKMGTIFMCLTSANTRHAIKAFMGFNSYNPKIMTYQWVFENRQMILE